ncbi:hypothetical protein [Nocardioides daeguensis]|uniref:Uncharacterized protein n=1 Tax=Nocardioides daeguensis TaxID=908359 RepID=A0ABP6W0U5_9ACTN|nr:hypothetical protein [Nocardioides daeguensis]MBV6726673.1 hypothetical protein [Nocardioides daeguensis]MCR1774575.1 hypothetical protein [Nocardioides daeguensis]
MSALPVSARLAWWGTAWLRGLVGPDEVLDAVHGDDVTHVVLSPDGPSSLLLELAAARNHGAEIVGAAYPAPGDPAGLRGPRELTTAAVEAGEVVLLPGTGLVPRQVGRAVEWTVLPAERRPPPDLGDADRQLRAALLTAANLLADLDVARWQPLVADELHDLRTAVPVTAPPGTPARCVDLAGRALHLEAVVELALQDDGGALSVSDATARRAALEPLERAARHALTAACSPDGWPPA